jgi:peptidoglycan/LPS O-acetylase OafA/YrhL
LQSYGPVSELSEQDNFMKDSKPSAPRRIPYLDALRGIAILLVILFHAFARWPQIMPYGSKYTTFPLFYSGWLGVNLFFMISGFVILMTLEKCGTFAEFMKRRWLRLFPAMFIASVIIILTAGYLSERPMGTPRVQDFFPGVTFIHPFFLSKLSGINIESLEGSFWSLYVEFFFYIFFGTLFFISRKKALWFFSAASVAGYAFFRISLYNFPTHTSAHICNDIFGFQHYSWFAAGAFTYRYFLQRDRDSLAGMIMMSAFSFFTILLRQDMILTMSALAVIGVFIAPVFSDTMRRILGLKILVFAGFISYPLYLIHENMLVSLTSKAGRYFAGLPDFILPVIPILFLSAVAYIIAKHAEPRLKNAIVRFTGK